VKTGAGSSTPNPRGYLGVSQLDSGRQANAVLVALTVWGQTEDRQKTKEAGFEYHLVKPADPLDIAILTGATFISPFQSAEDIEDPIRANLRVEYGWPVQ
jgi:CheY-like chemotaxis protein